MIDHGQARSVSPVEAEHNASSCDIYVDFDGEQITVSSNIPAISDYVSVQFANMIVPALNAHAGTLQVLESPGGLIFRTPDGTELKGIDVAQAFPLLKDEVRLQFMRTRPDLLWLHAGAVECGGKAILLAGATGQGKSTLTATLCERGQGWKYLSDDIAPVSMHANEVLPFPQAPVRRVHPGRELPAEEIHAIRREIVEFPSERIRVDPAPIRCIVFVRYLAGAPASLTSLSAGAAALEILRNATNFVDHKEAAVDRAASMARQLPAFSLTYGSSENAAKLVHSLC